MPDKNNMRAANDNGNADRSVNLLFSIIDALARLSAEQKIKDAANDNDACTLE